MARLTTSRVSAAWAIPLALAVTVARPALACPSCAAGIEARAELWSRDFALHLLAALVPFLIVGLACVYAERIGRQRAASARAESQIIPTRSSDDALAPSAGAHASRHQGSHGP
jgi:hypothetical protein